MNHPMLIDWLANRLVPVRPFRSTRHYFCRSTTGPHCCQSDFLLLFLQNYHKSHSWWSLPGFLSILEFELVHLHLSNGTLSSNFLKWRRDQAHPTDTKSQLGPNMEFQFHSWRCINFGSANFSV